MNLNNLEIYMDGLAVHLAYQYRQPFRVWSDLSCAEQEYWQAEAYELIKYLKKQKVKNATRTAKR